MPRAGKSGDAVFNGGTLDNAVIIKSTGNWYDAGLAVFRSGEDYARVELNRSGQINIGPGDIIPDVTIYRGGAGLLGTGNKFLMLLGFGVGNSQAATVLGSVVKKVEVFDETGASIGFIPVYDAIT